jgi:hypothetical protein
MMRTGISRAGLLCLPLLALAACGGAPDRQASEAPANAAIVAESAPAAVSQTPAASAPAAGAAAQPAGVDATRRSCSAEVGAAAAERLVKLCRNVSPATRPPCNAANSCAMIEDEIARSCALFDGQGSPMPGCRPAPRSKEAAAAVVKRYYAALDARDYDTAWAQWGEDGPPNQSRDKFAEGYARTRSTRVTIEALEPGEGAAGSIYQTVPVTVDAALADGTHQRFTGSYVVRRVNGVDGASPAQLRWHIDSAKLSPVRG